LLKVWTLRLHRWLALIFALPLLAIFVTGFILAFEPAIVASGVKPNTVEAAQVEAALANHDPQGLAKRIYIHAHLGTLVLHKRGGPEINLATGERANQQSTTLSTFALAREIHEKLLFDAGWAVTASTFAMLALVLVGLAMGTRPARNTISGWHTTAAWIALPVIVLLPLTGLAMVYKVTLAGPQPSIPTTAMPASLIDAFRIVTRDRDVATLLSLRVRNDEAEARFMENGELRSYVVLSDGLVAKPRNWPKLLHEGNWAGVWSASANSAASLLLILLLATGVLIWTRRQLRRRRQIADRSKRC
jgi:uncharacterized iron-regulated membrane protein